MNPEFCDETQDEADQMAAVSGECHFRTSFGFLNTHNGIRKNKMHMLISPTSGGKSTIVRSVLRDVIFNNTDKKILLFLSEETVQEFKDEFYKGVPVCKRLKDSLVIISQVNQDYSGDELKKKIEEIIEFYNIDLFVFDNLTTSRKLHLGQSVPTQDETVMWLKSLCKTTTVFVIAHTNTTDYNNRLITENDIRGTKTTVNVTEFLYILQPINVGNALNQFIIIKKNRGVKCSNKTFKMNFCDKIMSFENDTAVNFAEMKRIFKLRNKLEGA